MNQKQKKIMGLLAFFLTLTMTFAAFCTAALAVEPNELQSTEATENLPQQTEPEETEPQETEPEETEPQETEPEETEPEETEPEETEPEETEPEETEPEETEPEETEPQETEPMEQYVQVCWTMDSTLGCSLDADDYSWQVYDVDGNQLQSNAGIPAYAGYARTGVGHWYGSAEITLTITNCMDQTARLQLLFMDGLAPLALRISGTLEAQNGMVHYDPETGLLVVEPQATGVVTFTIDHQLLQEYGVAVQDGQVGSIQARMVRVAEEIHE